MTDPSDRSPVPELGWLVHYASHGTPVRADGSQAYPTTCRAAWVTGHGDMLPYPTPESGLLEDGPQLVDLCVINPTGMFFKQGVPEDPRPRGGTGELREGGTWHWPRPDCR